MNKNKYRVFFKDDGPIGYGWGNDWVQVFAFNPTEAVLLAIANRINNAVNWRTFCDCSVFNENSKDWLPLSSDFIDDISDTISNL